MRIKRKFLQLTRKTYPHQTENQLLSYLPEGFQKDEFGNYFLIIGDSDPNTMFTCHLDTACSKQEIVRHTFNGNMIKTDGKTILGADDKAGMTVVLYMIENKVPGIYYFFIGEEVGCVGSTKAAQAWKYKNVTKCISFDRRGTGSVITHQFWGRCCSDEFALELSKQFNESGNNLYFQPDDTGILTDSAQFVAIIPECTNISVGYYKEHTKDESQDIDHLVKLCKACVKIDWDKLPVGRQAAPAGGDEFFEFYNREVRNYNSQQRAMKSNPVWAYLEEYGNVVECYLNKRRLEDEKDIIYNYVFTRHEYFDITGLSWDGNDAYVWYDADDKRFLATRRTLSAFCPKLNDIKASDCDLICYQPCLN